MAAPLRRRPVASRVRQQRTAPGKMSLLRSLRSLRLCLVVRAGSCPVSALGPGPVLPSLQVSRAPGTLPPLPLAAFGSISPFPAPQSLFMVQRPGAAFPPPPGSVSTKVASRPTCSHPTSSLLLPASHAFLLPPGGAPSASVAPAVAYISRWALAVLLGFQQGAPHEAAAENGLLLCKLQEGSGDLWRGSQTGVGEEVEGSRRWGGSGVLGPDPSAFGRSRRSQICCPVIHNDRVLDRILTSMTVSPIDSYLFRSN